VDSKLKAFEDFLSEQSKTAFSNPDRLGCPSQEFLKNLASHKIPIEKTAAWIDHLGSCSECFQDFTRFSESVPRKGHRMRLIALGSVAALLCFVFVGDYVIHHRVSSPGQNAPLSSQNTNKGAAQPTMAAVLHLEEVPVVRGDDRPPSIPKMRRGLLSLSIYLPPDSKPGSYTIRILSRPADKKDVLTFSGTAETTDGDTILHASADLTSVSPGSYYLALRHDGGVWRYYRVILS
jgi:hypothetical protein